MSLANARKKARDFHEMARDGINPIEAAKKDTLTFREATQRVHSNLSPTWRNKKHTETWLATVENYACAQFGNKPIEQVNSADSRDAMKKAKKRENLYGNESWWMPGSPIPARAPDLGSVFGQ